MKVPAGQADGFVARPPATVRVILVYGPDDGLVRERARTALAAIAEDPDDPFRVVELSAAALAADPGRLAEELAAQSFTGGRRVARIADAGDRMTAAVEAVLDRCPGDGVAVLEAGDLAPKSSLRKVCEGAQTAGAVPCYTDDAGALARLIDQEMTAHGLRLAPDARAWLVDHVGSDRGVTRQELAKLILYVGPGESGRTVGLDTVQAISGDSTAQGLDDLVFAVASGDLATVDRLLVRLAREGEAPVGLLRRVQGHFRRLQWVSARIQQGMAPAEALKGLRPPVFFKRTQAFQSQARNWAPNLIQAALGLLVDAEIQCKTTGLPDRAICERALLALARKAPRGR